MHGESSANVQESVVNARMVNQRELDFGLLAGYYRTRTSGSDNAEPLAVRNDEVWPIALGERRMPPALLLGLHVQVNKNSRDHLGT